MMLAHDRELLSLNRITWRGSSVEFKDPLK